MEAIYTMGFTKKDAKTFFETIKENHIRLLIDIRLNNQSQLAGFTKGKDLEYLLKEIACCDYEHDLVFAPTKELLDDYKKGRINWEGYVRVFSELIEKRDMAKHFSNKYGYRDRILLLCSEPTPEQCHRRLVAEAAAKMQGCKIVHL